MTQKLIVRLLSMLLAVGVTACAVGDGSAGASAGVGEGSALATSGSTPAGQCPTEVTADSTHCGWEVDPRTRRATLVCVVGAQTFRVDSSGVGEGKRTSPIRR